MRNMKNITVLFAIAGIVLVFLTHKGINSMSLYNTSPLVFALLPLLLLRSKAKERQYATIGFSATAIALPIVSHFLWAVGANTSSTGGIMFVWLPIYSLGLACVGAALGTAIGLIHEYRNRRWPNQAL